MIDNETLMYPGEDLGSDRINISDCFLRFESLRNNFAASNRTALHGSTAGSESTPGSLPGNPLNDPENPRYGSALEAEVVPTLEVARVWWRCGNGAANHLCNEKSLATTSVGRGLESGLASFKPKTFLNSVAVVGEQEQQYFGFADKRGGIHNHLKGQKELP